MNLKYVKTVYAIDRDELQRILEKSLDLKFIITVKQLREIPVMFRSISGTSKKDAQFKVCLYNVIPEFQDEDEPFLEEDE